MLYLNFKKLNHKMYQNYVKKSTDETQYFAY